MMGLVEVAHMSRHNAKWKVALLADWVADYGLKPHRSARVNKRILARRHRRQVNYWRSVRDRFQAWRLPADHPLRYWVRGEVDPNYQRRIEEAFRAAGLPFHLTVCRMPDDSVVVELSP